MKHSDAVTLADVAGAVGVHPSTASRVLSGQMTGTPTAERILAAAAEMGYRPNLAAASLRTRNSRVLGVLVPRFTDYVLARVYEGIDDAAFAAGYSTVATYSQDHDSSRLERLEALLDRRVDGVVIADARPQNDEVIDALAHGAVPFALAVRRSRGQLSATVNDTVGGALAASHLVATGHSRVAVLRGPENASTATERTRGFLEEAKRLSMHVPEALVVPSEFDEESGYQATRLLLRRAKVTAIFATNDLAAVGAMGALREASLQPGRDVALIGYNDVPFVRHLPVPLTSIDSPIYELGRRATTLLLRRLAGENVRSVRLTPNLVARASTLDYMPLRDARRAAH
ncbi:LacI family DNA-binding transcriptional regulator [Pedococcus sp. NPDC057267]|uniref:LacI family DNA-binding transcriptional regulator n=1 Tax=Pedococcus sp. NPDC057267 TaxID=3346077 RepID=UPI00363F0237